MKTNIINNVPSNERLEKTSQDPITYDYWANHFCFCLEDEFDDPIENARFSEETENNYYRAAS